MAIVGAIPYGLAGINHLLHKKRNKLQNVAMASAEIQISEYLAEGQSAEFIAARRGVTVETVRTQIKAVMAKLGVSRQVELVVWLGDS